jgi:hypothetical protein
MRKMRRREKSKRRKRRKKKIGKNLSLINFGGRIKDNL